MSQNNYRTELDLLISLRDERLAICKTDIERAAAGPQIVAFSKQIESLTDKCRRFDLQTSTMLEKGTIESFAAAVVEIVAQELAGLPDFEMFPQRLIDATHNAEAGFALQGMLTDVPDRISVVTNIASRVVELAAGLTNGEEKTD